MPQLTFNPELTLTGFRITRPSCFNVISKSRRGNTLINSGEFFQLSMNKCDICQLEVHAVNLYHLYYQLVPGRQLGSKKSNEALYDAVACYFFTQRQQTRINLEVVTDCSKTSEQSRTTCIRLLTYLFTYSFTCF